MKYLGLYLFIVNMLGFAIMGIDKNKAKKNKWRIRERTLFFFSIVGGSIGTLVGMYFFHHKTQHWYFVLGMPFILILQLALAYYVINLA